MLGPIRAFVAQVAKAFPAERVVEFGSKTIPWQAELADLRPLFVGAQYTGVDYKLGLGVDVQGDVCRMPFKDASVNLLLMCEILEHCEEPWTALQEAKRVLAPGGLLLATVPFLHPIHHMPDYWRITPQGMGLLLARVGPWVSYYQGDLALPRTVFGLAAKSETTLQAVTNELEQHLSEVPGRWVGEKLYKWTTERDYAKMRYGWKNHETFLEENFGIYNSQGVS